MIRFAKWLPCVAVIAGTVMLGTASPARADIELLLSEQGSGSPVTQSSTDNQGPVSYSGAVGNDFSVLMAYGDSNSPGGSPALAEEGSIKITNNSSSQQTITITVSAQGFNNPNSSPSTGPLAVLDTVSGSVLTGSLVSGTAQGFADATNALNGRSFASTLLNFGPVVGPSNSFAESGGMGGFNPNGATYSLTFTETFTLAGHSTLTLTGGNVTAVPEPASVMAALSAVPFLALGAWLRRRKQVAIA